MPKRFGNQRLKHYNIGMIAASGDLLNDWLNLGLAGVIIVSLLTGLLVPGNIYKEVKTELQAEKDNAVKQGERVYEMMDMVKSEFIPELERNRAAQQALVAMLERLSLFLKQ